MKKFRETPGCPCCELARLMVRYERHLVAANQTMLAMADVVRTHTGPGGFFEEAQLHDAAPHQREMARALFAARDASFPFGRALGVDTPEAAAGSMSQGRGN